MTVAGSAGSASGIFSGAAYAWFEANLGQFKYGVHGTGDLSVLVP